MWRNWVRWCIRRANPSETLSQSRMQILPANRVVTIGRLSAMGRHKRKSFIRMKTLPETPFNKAADYSIMCLLSSFALQSVVAILSPGSSRSSQVFPVAVGLLVILVLGVALAWRQLFRRERNSFTTAGIACVVTFVGQRLVQEFTSLPDSLSRRFVAIVLSPQVLLALYVGGFMAVRHFRDRFNNDRSPRYLLVGIGVVMLVWSAGGLAFQPCSLALVLGGIIGVGCIFREPVMGVIGFWLASALWLVNAFMAISSGVPVILFVGFAGFLAAMAAVLNKFLADEFHWEQVRRAWDEMNRPTPSGYQSRISVSKSCSQCGREVPVFSHAGGRCPHCGAHWSFERNGGFRH